MQLKKMLIGASMLMASSVMAGGQDQITDGELTDATFNHFTISTTVGTANYTLTDADIGEWQLAENVAIQYAFNQNFFVGASLNFMRKDQFGYKIDGGFELPTTYFTPYVQMTFNHANTDGNGYYSQSTSIDYAIGTTFAAPWTHGFSVLAELKNPIKSNESVKGGVGYNFTNDFSVGAYYWVGLNGKANGLESTLEYAFN